MDKQKKKELRIKIGMLLDKKCHPCVTKACENCEVNKEIRKLSIIIDIPSEKLPPKEEVVIENVNPLCKVTKRQYMKLSSQGLNDKEIAKMFGLHYQTLAKNKGKWGLTKKRKSKASLLNKEKYIELKCKHISDFKIAAEYQVGQGGIYYRKKKWGLIK